MADLVDVGGGAAIRSMLERVQQSLETEIMPEFATEVAATMAAMAPPKDLEYQVMMGAPGPGPGVTDSDGRMRFNKAVWLQDALLAGHATEGATALVGNLALLSSVGTYEWTNVDAKGTTYEHERSDPLVWLMFDLGGVFTVSPANYGKHHNLRPSVGQVVPKGGSMTKVVPGFNFLSGLDVPALIESFVFPRIAQAVNS